MKTQTLATDLAKAKKLYDKALESMVQFLQEEINKNSISKNKIDPQTRGKAVLNILNGQGFSHETLIRVYERFCEIVGEEPASAIAETPAIPQNVLEKIATIEEQNKDLTKKVGELEEKNRETKELLKKVSQELSLAKEEKDQQEQTEIKTPETNSGLLLSLQEVALTSTKKDRETILGFFIRHQKRNTKNTKGEKVSYYRYIASKSFRVSSTKKKQVNIPLGTNLPSKEAIEKRIKRYLKDRPEIKNRMAQIHPEYFCEITEAPVLEGNPQ